MNNILNKTLAFLQQHNPTAALHAIAPLLAAQPNHVDGLFLKAIGLSMAGDKAQAIASYDRLLEINPGHLGALMNRGADQLALHQYEAAYHSLVEAQKIEPTNPMVLLNLGYVENGRHNPTAALTFIDRALNTHAQYPEAWCAKGDALGQLGEVDLAIHAYRKAMSLNPNYLDAPNNLGLLLVQEHRLNEAVEIFKKALLANPHSATLYNNLGIALSRSPNADRMSEAQQAYVQAIRLEPAMADAYLNMAELLVAQKQYLDASNFYEAALERSTNRASVIAPMLHNLMKLCLWDRYESLVSELLTGIDYRQGTISPFNVLGLPSTRRQQQYCAVDFSKSAFGQPSIQPRPFTKRPKEAVKIRIGYLSNDFQGHATAYLMAELFELHNRDRFEVFAYSYSTTAQDAMRDRIFRACDHFTDISNLSDTNAAAKISADQIDILVDLKGHTEGARLGILTHKPAPIQVHYLGYPGTTGATFVDYLIADPILIRPGEESAYTEKIVRLPDTYQVNDRTRAIAQIEDSKADHGLSEDHFIFCCFNNNWKITPEIFDTWIGLLHKCEQSTLWLIQDNPEAAKNLKRTAAAKGIAPDRIVFAQKLPLDRHLARHRHADLFLDTPYYNAHTTASDALWTGLPVLTLKGATFAGRVAESLSLAAGLPEMVAETLEDYASIAHYYYTHKDALEAIRAKLNTSRWITPLFDTPRFTRNLERAFVTMHQRFSAELAPDHLTI